MADTHAQSAAAAASAFTPAPTPADSMKNEYDAFPSPVSEESHANKPATTRPAVVAFDMPATRRPPLAITGIQTGAWSTGLFNCFDFCVPNCLMATVFPCIAVAQIAPRVGFQYWTVLLAFGVLIGLEYLSYFLMAVTTLDDTLQYIVYAVKAVSFLAYCQVRATVRQYYGLPGSCVEDIVVSWCCSCCAIAQMATHVKSYTPSSCGFGPPDELPAYDDGDE